MKNNDKSRLNLRPFLFRTAPLALALQVVLAAPLAASETADAEQATELAPVEVVGARIDDVEGGRVGAKVDAPLREIPQSVSVVTREQIEQRGATTVEQALRYTAGISLPYGFDARYDWMDIRGFSAVNEMFRDGLRQQSGTFSAPRLDPYALERIEVLKGPAGVMYGAGSPGGLINQVSKRATGEQVNEVGVSYGNYDRVSLRTDFGGALGDGWRYRVVALGSDADDQVDFTGNRRSLLMPSLAWSNESTSLDLQATWQKDDGRYNFSFQPGRGVRDLLGLDYDVPRDRYLGEPGFDRFDREHATFGYTFEHRFNDTWLLRQNARYNRTELDYGTIGIVGFNLAQPTEVTRYVLLRDELSRGVVIDTSLQASFGHGRVRHTVLAGIDVQRIENDEYGVYTGGNDPVTGLPYVANLDLVNPVYGSPVTVPPGARMVTDGRQVGLYLQDHIKFDDRWVLLLGGRYDEARQKIKGTTSTTDYAFSGRAGLVYLAEDGFAPYLSYSESFSPLYSSGFKPETGHQVELGVRWQPIGSSVLISGALFDLRRENMVVTDPANPMQQVQVGESRSRGAEAEINTEIAANTRLTAAYTYLDTEVLNNGGMIDEGSQLPRVPKHSASLFLDYTLPAGPVSGLQLGAGVRYVGETLYTGGSLMNPAERVQVRTGAYTLVDASVRYPWRNWQFTLTGSNLFDREYSISCDNNVCYGGYARSVNLSANYRW
jgi:iron complex outermembrane receptor protein